MLPKHTETQYRYHAEKKGSSNYKCSVVKNLVNEELTNNITLH